MVDYNKNQNDLYSSDMYSDDIADSAVFKDDDSGDYKKGYKLYNFRRPDKFSKDHLRALQDLHREFSRQISLILTAYLRMRIEIEVVSTDQLTYDEFIRSMPSPMTIGIFELNPLPGQILLGVSFEVLSCIVDRMLGGLGLSEYKQRELTDIEEALSKKVIERIVKALEGAWSNIVPVQGNVVGLDNNYQMVQVASTGEIVALITFEVQIAGKYFGLISLCFPYPVLETVLGNLSTQHIFQTKGIIATTEERQKMIDKLNTSKVDLSVLFGSTDISLEEFLDLKEGDIIKLDAKTTDDLIVKVNGEKKYFARPGTLKDKVCVKITEVYDHQKDLLKHYYEKGKL
ncbi:MAG: flagellar motor switch protein FliM [Candidatus Melainabacteria bacterium]|nr:MAG: flagellar motor switch protein FliM [Candidatus Melainabacteria bacterium]RAI11639.1 MAG: flagellar motor switch protein FliM [Candidatus Melainabacteria bacterium]